MIIQKVRMQESNAFIIGTLISLGLWMCGTNILGAIRSFVAFCALGGWMLIRKLQVIPRDIR